MGGVGRATMARNLSEAGPYRYTILDCDLKFDATVTTFLNATGLRPKRKSTYRRGKRRVDRHRKPSMGIWLVSPIPVELPGGRHPAQTSFEEVSAATISRPPSRRAGTSDQRLPTRERAGAAIPRSIPCALDSARGARAVSRGSADLEMAHEASSVLALLASSRSGVQEPCRTSRAPEPPPVVTPCRTAGAIPHSIPCALDSSSGAKAAFARTGRSGDRA